jgi:hypothetical protein
MSKQYLSAEEIADFWALDLAIEATYVPEDEWIRALGEKRVQETSMYSSMGTAETGWSHASSPTTSRERCAVVPPGQIAEDTEYQDLQDDRDVIRVCWSWFWNAQRTTALAKLPADKHDAFLEECAHILVELEQNWKHDRDNPKRLLLVDWLISANKLPADKLEEQLDEIKSSALSHLVRGVRARWLRRDVRMAFEAVLASAERGKEKDFYGYGNIPHQREVRMQLLRVIVRLVRKS